MPMGTLRGISLFDTTDPKDKKEQVHNIETKHLNHYHNHIFKLYEGERLEDMVESIKANGVYSPLIVRPLENDKINYEVLSGHNRLEASKIVGLEFVPCIVKEDLTDEEAELIVTETNLLQRSFSDLSHSERASSLAVHYEAMKCQGKRNDLILELQELQKNADKCDNHGENLALSPMGHRLNSREKIGEKYNLSKNSVARYLRINLLQQPLKEMIDNGTLSIRAGVALSYLKENEQTILLEYITENEKKVDIKKAEILKQLSQDDKFNVENVERVFLGKKKADKPKKAKAYTVSVKKFDDYFNGYETQEEFEETIEKALKYYHAHKDEALEELAENNADELE